MKYCRNIFRVMPFYCAFQITRYEILNIVYVLHSKVLRQHCWQENNTYVEHVMYCRKYIKCQLILIIIMYDNM